MMHQERIAFYQERAQSFSNKLQDKISLINSISLFRLLTAIAVLPSVYYSFKVVELTGIVLLLVGLFVWLIRWHARLFDEKTLLENFVAINKAEAEALKGNYSYQPTGSEFLDSHHSYSYDLDLFGEASLFQYTNRASTAGGRGMMALSLQHPLSSHETIVQRQHAVQELAGNIEFRQLFQAIATNSNDTQEDRSQLQEWLRQPAMFYGKIFFRYALWLIPIVTLLLIAASLFISTLRPLAILSVLTQWSITGFNFKKITLFHDYVSRKKNLLMKYSQLVAAFNKEKVSSLKLQQLSQATHQAETRIKSLADRVGALDARLNFMTSLVLNTTLMYDLQCVYRLEQWKEENGNDLTRWLDAISEVELLISYATLAYNNPSFCYASIHESLSIKGLSLSHPLLSESERIANDLYIGMPQAVLIVTGANMAGKSTFLRTLGVNLVLALNGAPVCAKEFTCPVLDIRSGMRTTDSLKDHQSYFYAELNRLKSITDELRQDKPLLILLDEILKGTNSTDKQTGSIALVRQLIQHPCLAIVATHDLVLGELEKQFPEKIKNYHFEPTIENDELSFDYLLKPGIAEKMNATFLMRKMGIIPS
jgi:DNA mismatch repair ATPase MutS